MSALGQQQLMEVSPARRIVVPRGHCSWWGVDPSTLRVALAGVSRQSDESLGRWVQTQPFAPVEGPARLSEIYTVTRRFVVSVATCCTWPGIVFVEQPSGGKQQVNLPLIYAVGVIQAAVWDGLFEVMGVAPRMETVTSSSWKKTACGRGNIYKPKRGDTHEYGVLSWARLNGYAGWSWDEADALAIAEAARRTVALEER